MNLKVNFCVPENKILIAHLFQKEILVLIHQGLQFFSAITDCIISTIKMSTEQLLLDEILWFWKELTSLLDISKKLTKCF